MMNPQQMNPQQQEMFDRPFWTAFKKEWYLGLILMVPFFGAMLRNTASDYRISALAGWFAALCVWIVTVYHKATIGLQDILIDKLQEENKAQWELLDESTDIMRDTKRILDETAARFDAINGEAQGLASSLQDLETELGLCKKQAD